MVYNTNEMKKLSFLTFFAVVAGLVLTACIGGFRPPIVLEPLPRLDTAPIEIEIVSWFPQGRVAVYRSATHTIQVNETWGTVRRSDGRRMVTPTILAHEFCHAHQHYALGDGPFIEWPDFFTTNEGRSYVEAVRQEPGLNANYLEDYAAVCARFYTIPDTLDVVPVRKAWAYENLPKYPPLGLEEYFASFGVILPLR